MDNIKHGYIRNVSGYSPFSYASKPYNATVGFVGLFLDDAVNTAQPVASTDYTAKLADYVVTSTGGTDVAITITDSKGNTVETGLTTLAAKLLPRDWKINFGAFSGAPTTYVYAVT